MNTYDISVKGKTILKKVVNDDLEDTVKMIRGLVWLNGGSECDIKVSINKNTTD